MDSVKEKLRRKLTTSSVHPFAEGPSRSAEKRKLDRKRASLRRSYVVSITTQKKRWMEKKSELGLTDTALAKVLLDT